MTKDSETLQDFDRHVFYHGTTLEAAESIAREGFRVWFQDDDSGRYASEGNLGTGVYLTCNWRIALWYGPALLRVAIRPGTRILDATLPPDERIIASLQKAFGREILKQPPWKVLPKNKKLTRHELTALFCYHYRQTWEKEYGEDRNGLPKWPAKRERHARLLKHFRSLLVRYGFHGYGNPSDDNGIVIFTEDRLVLKELVACISPRDYETLHAEDFQHFQNLDVLRQYFQRHGPQRARELAQHIARVNP